MTTPTTPAKPTGRPCKLTPEVHAAIVARVRRGDFKETACMAEGIDPTTFRRWLRVAAEERQARAAGSENPEREKFIAFARDIDAAEAESEAGEVQAIALAAEDQHDDNGRLHRGDWKARAWILERKNPKRFGLRVRMTVDDELASFLDRCAANLDPETFERVLALAAGGDSGGAPRLPARGEGDDADEG